MIQNSTVKLYEHTNLKLDNIFLSSLIYLRNGFVLRKYGYQFSNELEMNILIRYQMTSKANTVAFANPLFLTPCNTMSDNTNYTHRYIEYATLGARG